MKLDIITELIGKLEEEEVVNVVNDFVQSNPSKEDALKVIEACEKGMAIVGRHFENREYFIGDVIYAGELQELILDLLEPVIGSCNVNPCAIKLGRVYGEPRNIGEHLFKSIIESSGYVVST